MRFNRFIAVISNDSAYGMVSDIPASCPLDGHAIRIILLPLKGDIHPIRLIEEIEFQR